MKSLRLDSLPRQLLLVVSDARGEHVGQALWQKNGGAWECVGADFALSDLRGKTPLYVAMYLARRGLSWNWRKPTWRRFVTSPSLPLSSRYEAL